MWWKSCSCWQRCGWWHVGSSVLSVSGRDSASVCWHGGRALNGEIGCGWCVRADWIGFGVVIVSDGMSRCFCSGMNFLRKLWVVLLPDLSTRTTYWSNCCTSMMTPVLSHRVGCGPVWFWICTWSPTTRGRSLSVCSATSQSLACACSLKLLPLQRGCHSRLGDFYRSQKGCEQNVRAPKDAPGMW